MEKIEMISVKEISKVLGIGINQAYDLVKKDGFPKLRIGQKYLVPRDKFEEWIEKSLYDKV